MTPQRRQNKTDPVIVQGKFMTVATEIRTILHFDWSIKPNLISVSVATALALILPPLPRQRAVLQQGNLQVRRQVQDGSHDGDWMRRRRCRLCLPRSRVPPYLRCIRDFFLLFNNQDTTKTPLTSIAFRLPSFLSPYSLKIAIFYRLPPRGKYVKQRHFSMF